MTEFYLLPCEAHFITCSSINWKCQCSLLLFLQNALCTHRDKGQENFQLVPLGLFVEGLKMTIEKANYFET